VNVRPCAQSDLERINEIYNHYVRTTPITFDIEDIKIDARREWLTHYAETGRHRAFVADDDGVVLGFATSSFFRPKRAYETSVEATVYVDADHGGRGIGTKLYETLFAAIANADIHRIYAGITMPNEASVALHAKFGFRQAGYFTEQGRKFGRYWDVAWFEREMT